MLTVWSLQAATNEIKPGFNLFSKDQDIQLGKEAGQEVERQLPVVRNQPELQDYLSQLGSRLAKVSYDPSYPYNFHIVADKAINAFALPGGPIFVNTATINAAENEAQLAGVLAHEISHVGLRHSTNQASKANFWQIPLAIAGLATGGSLLGELTQIGLGLGVNSVLLKYSRDAEHDADILGARTMAKAGYDPVEMARFFEKLKAQLGSGGSVAQFLSDHPDPGNRVKYVEDEVKALPSREYTKGSGNFGRYRDLAARVPAPDKQQARHGEAGGGQQHPEPPSSEVREFRGAGFRFSYPANWKTYGKEKDVTIAPEQGLVQSGGGVQIGMGAMAGFFSAKATNITAATDQLIQDLRSKNPDMREVRGQRQSVTVDGSNGETILLVGSSPLGSQQEMDSLLTATRPEGLFYLILIAPESDYNNLRPTFQKMQNSVRFR